MPYSMRSYVVTEKFFEKQFPDGFKRLEDFLGFVGKKTIENRNVFFACTFPDITGPVYMFAVSDYPLTLKESALNELMIRMNDVAKRASIKRNPSGVCYASCTHELQNEPISERSLLRMYYGCLQILLHFESLADEMVNEEGLPSALERLKSNFPYHSDDLKGFMDGTKEDPWNLDAPPLEPSRRRLRLFNCLYEYDKAQKWFAQQKEKADTDE